ncbi:MAG: tRNA preQ1(34) S-adenosylmethionine ribosyltransferase-isomerase QueA [Gammaproteobacteria bacterium TMED242]|uniref:S-adenosylmethionine:tRNA ribosyltransferase-isomerase n=1 Tax=SAR86 cluster bacterium TaxID=2030880 RepID=A0A520MGL6_9GAMM|nr:MAG: tRNA preQ1(34) S-adenosylmethionine ribosyltransferase-isomerase QueA [Gammaproteobacteria bacterium TMED242]OUX09010.1 MAG: tRNA preQ1(34) S-adenosylmethionine ribosyltransferase-isomerase QueA [Gammaproteobacteria bacterium TMED242]RZO20376.1 MAG: tRNA preQ1(34) S-adenosylmethionine ribosyltransferase-isomerase QueA [SAR86 cluster bacterium]|tara:strand:+ start:53 stop:1072 length:1020 start_codon:yes stop_codon:yes gene_type:complete
MKTSDFNYALPEELIAKYPLEKRSLSKLLVYSDKIDHKCFKDILNYFEEGDLLVVNNTSVIPARIFGHKDSGGSVEVMLERVMENNQALVQMRSGRAPKIGAVIILDTFEVECIDRQDNFFILQFDRPPLEVFNAIGHIPLPPYIKRPDEDFDKERYSTVYENKELQGSVAAPTAGLHFDDELLNSIKKIGVKIATVNLSVGAGTFQPVKVENIEEHDIHSEFLEVSADVVDMVIATKKAGKKVFAVGTTAIRALETAFNDESEKGFSGYTKLFIYPGYKFKVVDMLITNFHLPQSSLLMLVSAFIGYDNMRHIYKTAVDKKYRFLSYGDAMLLEKNEI